MIASRTCTEQEFRQKLKEAAGAGGDSMPEIFTALELWRQLPVKVGDNPSASIDAKDGCSPEFGGLHVLEHGVPYVGFVVTSADCLPVHAALLLDMEGKPLVAIPVEGNTFNVTRKAAFGCNPAEDVDNIIVRTVSGSLRGVDIDAWPGEANPEADPVGWHRGLLDKLRGVLLPHHEKMLEDLQTGVIAVVEEQGTGDQPATTAPALPAGLPAKPEITERIDKSKLGKALKAALHYYINGADEEAWKEGLLRIPEAEWRSWTEEAAGEEDIIAFSHRHFRQTLGNDFPLPIRAVGASGSVVLYRPGAVQPDDEPGKARYDQARGRLAEMIKAMADRLAETAADLAKDAP